jgi:hypothetical protein
VSKMRWFHIYLATMFTVSAAAVVLAFLIVGPHQLSARVLVVAVGMAG